MERAKHNRINAKTSSGVPLLHCTKPWDLCVVGGRSKGVGGRSKGVFVCVREINFIFGQNVQSVGFEVKV